MTTPQRFCYLSLGAGVQSTALYVLSMTGRHRCPRATVAYFADTQAEPGYVYEHLDRLRDWAAHAAAPIPIETVTRGSLSEQVLVAGPHDRVVSIPAFVRGQDGRAAPTRRQCTYEYKIQPIHQALRRRLGYRPRQPMRHEITSLIGISLDEITRAKPSAFSWETKRYPLIDAGLTRRACIQFLRDMRAPVPNRSACVFCPFHSDNYWLWLRTAHADEWERACAFDDALRTVRHRGLVGTPYVHRSLSPLRDVRLQGPAPLPLFPEFTAECEGMCGV